MHRQYVHIDQRAIAYLDSAPGDKSASVCVFAHAFPLAASMWEPQFKTVPPGWRFVAPDMRGFGGSTLDGEGASPSIDDYADDVIDLLRELGITSAVVGGCSMGGYTTFAVLRRAPGLARGVVLADTRGGADSLQGRANRKSLLALLERSGPSAVARDMMPKLLGRTTREQRSDIESGIRRLIKQQSQAAIRDAILRMMERPDSFASLRGVSVPALVIVGEEDELTPVEESRRLVEAMPKAELVIVPRAGHLANLESPAEFNSALSTFLSRL